MGYNSGGKSLEDQLQVILEVRKQIEQELTKVIDFEEKLAQISPQRLEMLRPDMLTPYTIEQLSDEFPFLDWKEFFDSALQDPLGNDMQLLSGQLFVFELSYHYLSVSNL